VTTGFDTFIVSYYFLLVLSLQDLWLEVVDKEISFYWNKLDLNPDDFPQGSRLALLRLFSTVFDPGSPIARFSDEWEKLFNRLNMFKQFHPDKKLLYAHLQPVGSQLISLEEVKFLPPAVVSPAIYHYFSTKWTAFHGSMQRGVCVNPRHDAALFQQDLFQRLTAVWRSWRILNFFTHMDCNSRSTN
jgi:hypothetical protein